RPVPVAEPSDGPVQTASIAAGVPNLRPERHRAAGRCDTDHQRGAGGGQYRRNGIGRGRRTACGRPQLGDQQRRRERAHPGAAAGTGLLEGTLHAVTSAGSDKLLDMVGLGGKSAADKGNDAGDYLAAAVPELNAWERAGADASSAGMVDAVCRKQKELTILQL